MSIRQHAWPKAAACRRFAPLESRLPKAAGPSGALTRSSRSTRRPGPAAPGADTVQPGAFRFHPRAFARLRLGRGKRPVRVRLEPWPARDQAQDRQGAAALLRWRRVGRVHPLRRRGSGPGAESRRQPQDAQPGRLRHRLPDRVLPPAHRGAVRPHRALDADGTGDTTGARSRATTSPRVYGADEASRIADPADPRASSPGNLPELGRQGQRRQLYLHRRRQRRRRHGRGMRGEPHRGDAGGAGLPQGHPVRERPAVLPRLLGRRAGRVPGRLDVPGRARLRGSRELAAGAGGGRPWPVRPDPFSTYRAGFEVRTYRRVQRFLFFNNFPGELTAGADCLVRSLDLAYSDQQAPADPRNPSYTFLVSVTETGYRQERRPDRRVHAAGRIRVQPAADRAGGADPRPGQPGQPPGRAGRRQVPVGGPGRRGAVRRPDRAPAAPGTTSGTSAPGTTSRSPTARPPRGRGSGRWRPSPACPRAATCPASGCWTCPASGRLDVVSLSEPDAGLLRAHAGRGLRAAAAVRRAAGARLVGSERHSSSTSPATGSRTS